MQLNCGTKHILFNKLKLAHGTVLKLSYYVGQISFFNYVMKRMLIQFKNRDNILVLRTKKQL